VKIKIIFYNKQQAQRRTTFDDVVARGVQVWKVWY